MYRSKIASCLLETLKHGTSAISTTITINNGYCAEISNEDAEG